MTDLSLDQKITKIISLVNELNVLRSNYYNNTGDIVDDYIYDMKFDQLQQLETETNFRLSNSPTVTVGFPVQSELANSKHRFDMLSLDKTKSVDKLLEFIGDKPAIMMHKLDGLTICCTYENGKLIKAETRGDGYIGKDITENAKAFSNLPLSIGLNRTCTVFGEAIIDYSTFVRISKENPEKGYKTPRNLCSGTVQSLDSSICRKRNVRFIAWRFVEGSTSNCFSDCLDELKQLGFETVEYQKVDKNNITSQLNIMKEWADHNAIPIDGCVISFEDVGYIHDLGATSHHLRGQLAYKFQEEVGSSILLNVEYSIGKTGILTPVAVFEPIDLGGTTVNRASLHNIDIASKLNIHVNNTVHVVKKNEIIPQIIACDADEPYFYIPYTCPYCGYIVDEIQDNNTTVLHCSNDHCQGKMLKQLSFFCSKQGLDIDGMSEATISFLMEQGWVHNYHDIFSLSDYKHEWCNKDGFGDTSVSKLLQAIDSSRNTTITKFLTALSIPLIGKSASKDIDNTFNGDIKTLLTDWENGFDFTIISNFGAAMNQSMHTYIQTNSNKEEILLLVQQLKFEQHIRNKSQCTPLNGIKFCITGTLAAYKNREELVSIIEAYGGAVVNSVSAKTNYLINNDINSTSSKNKKAKQLGVPIITENDFVMMIKEDNTNE